MTSEITLMANYSILYTATSALTALQMKKKMLFSALVLITGHMYLLGYGSGFFRSDLWSKPKARGP